MGVFSWMFADTGNKKALRLGKEGYIACPDGSFICTSWYDGYGRFGSEDVYELVVDWNKKHLAEIYETLEKEDPEHYDDELKVLAIAYQNDSKSDFNMELDRITALHPYLNKDWKRNIGIAIACYDEDNAMLPYPIKITSTKNQTYSELPSSKSDPNQGCS